MTAAPANPALLTPLEQEELGALLARTLEVWLAKKGKPRVTGLYVLVSWLWGEARRAGWTTRELANYCTASWTACERHIRGR